MKQLAHKEELSSLFTGLTPANQNYVLAVTRALVFAQDSPPLPPPSSCNSSSDPMEKQGT